MTFARIQAWYLGSNIKVTTSYQWGGFASAWLLAVTLHCAADDQIKVYTVPKEHPATQLALAPPAAGAPDIPINAAPIRWTLPAGWKEKPAERFRLASFAVNGEKGGQAEVVITSFPGSVGTELGNVNRWRGELALEPVGQGEIASEQVTVDSSPGKVYDIAGKSARTVVAVVQRNGNSWFIKLRGDSDAVAEAKSVFLEFLRSLHFGDNGAQAAAVSDPHAGLDLQEQRRDASATSATSATLPDGPKWNVPAQWVETGPRTMVLQSFAVAGDAGANAEITVSSFQGEAGGVLGNVNRWRGQMAQPPIDASQLDGVTESLAAVEGQATLVDFMGTNAKTGQPARLVGVIVPHGENTWFYKLMGDAKVVGGQKDSFVQFVKTVHYP
jgi:hypothetical protein